MKPTIPLQRPAAVAALAAGFVALAGLGAFGAAGWAEHGERLWLAMADGSWASCF